MRSIIFFSVLTVLTACGTQKEVTQANDKEIQAIENVEEGMVVGIVRVSDKGCPLYLDANEAGQALKMYPVNLDEKYKKDGIRIKFTYTPSRAMQPENCMVDKVVALENVVELR